MRCYLLVWLVLVVSAAFAPIAYADGLADNHPDSVRPIPPPGIEVPAEKRAKLEAELADLAERIEKARTTEGLDADLLPDVQIFHKAVDWALRYNEFFSEQEIDVAFELLAEGRARADQLANNEAPWTTATGLVVRGYISKIDGSVQPYGMIVPETYKGTREIVSSEEVILASITPEEVNKTITVKRAQLTHDHQRRLDIWCHGRGEKLSELNFIQDRRKNKGQFTPSDTFVLHPYGRYCNANKFAGEIDVLEAIDSVKVRYPIDEDRLVIRGFSMGGASAWHLAVHYSTMWAAANPGAGFAETPEFLKFFQKEELHPTWWERKLWHWYDCPDWVGNLRHCPTVAYSGENDIQKQAADIMLEAAKQDGFEIPHIIGPGTGHSYHADSAVEVERLLGPFLARGRQQYHDNLPDKLHFTTYTLRHNDCGWVRINALDEHWSKAKVECEFWNGCVLLRLVNVTSLNLRLPAEKLQHPTQLFVIDETHTPRKTSLVKTRSEKGGLNLELQRYEDQWDIARGFSPSTGNIRKKSVQRLPHKIHGLQGPIDDAFLSPFLFVRPTGKCRSEAVDKWVHAEMERAIEQWRRHFRGEIRVIDDRDVSDGREGYYNLVLWGDAKSNSVIAKLADKLPIKLDGSEIVVGSNILGAGRSFDATNHVPILIYPNPLGAVEKTSPPAAPPQYSNRYIVLNTGFTFREYAYLNNARQVAKLPDWAIVDIRTPPDSLWPGKIVDADFFDEAWQLKPPRSGLGE